MWQASSCLCKAAVTRCAHKLAQQAATRAALCGRQIRSAAALRSLTHHCQHLQRTASISSELHRKWLSTSAAAVPLDPASCEQRTANINDKAAPLASAAEPPYPFLSAS